MPDLERKFIEDGGVERIIQRSPEFAARLVPLSERERQRESTLSQFDADSDIWVFGYGSLIWNPILRYSEKRIARIYGYHRAFCQKTYLGRGTPTQPGLMAGLDRGGSCWGVAYRIATKDVECETRLLWNREAPLPVYKPRVLKATTCHGAICVITFTANRCPYYYAGPLSIEAQAEQIARAGGEMGTNAEYLSNLVKSLEKNGLLKASLKRLHSAVLNRLPEQRNRNA